MELARQLGVARGTVQARLDKLQKRGIISGFDPDLDLQAMGYEVLAFVTLEIAQGRLDDVIEHLADDPRGARGARHHRSRRPPLPRRRPHQRPPAGTCSAACSRCPGIMRTTTQIALSEQVRHRVLPLVAQVIDEATEPPAAPAGARDPLTAPQWAGRRVAARRRVAGHGPAPTATRCRCRRQPPLRQLWQHAGRHRPRVVLATVFSVLNKICDIAPELLIGAAVDVVVERRPVVHRRGVRRRGPVRPAHHPRRHHRGRLDRSSRSPTTSPSVLWRNLAQDIEHDMRMEAYRHVQELELAYFEDRSVGRADGRAQRRRQPARAVPRRRRQPADPHRSPTSCSSASPSSSSRPQLALLAFLPIPVIVVGSLRYQTHARAALRRRARGGRAHRRHAHQQPRRHRHHQGVHRRGARGRAGRRRQPRLRRGQRARRSATPAPSSRSSAWRSSPASPMTLSSAARAALDGDLEVGLYSVARVHDAAAAVAAHRARRDARPLPAGHGVVPADLRPARRSSRRIQPGTRDLPHAGARRGALRRRAASPTATGGRRPARPRPRHPRRRDPRHRRRHRRRQEHGREAAAPPLRADRGPDLHRRRAHPTSSPIGSLRGVDGLREPGRVPVPGHRPREPHLRPPRRHRRRRRAGRPPRRGPRLRRARCPTATTRSSASAARSSPAASASGSPSPAPSSATRRSSCSTRPPPRSTTRPRPPSSARWPACPPTAPRSSSPTASPRSATPTASTCSRPAQVIEAGTHEELVDRGGLYAALWRVQTGEAVTDRRSTTSTAVDLSLPATAHERGYSGAKPWRRVFSVLTRGVEELEQVVGAAGLRADAGHAVAAEGLAADDRAGDVAVEVHVAGPQLGRGPLEVHRRAGEAARR